jgi:IclR family mhp operon transcriptional activator
MSELSAHSGVERSSVYRLVKTLIQMGYVARREDDGAVALTPKFAYLADALKDDDIVTQFAWPPLFDLSKDVLWPCDFASIEGGRVLIRLSTHKISPMSIHRGMVGKERHLMRSALGQAILAAMTEQELETTFAIIEGLGGAAAEDIRDRAAVELVRERVSAQGYASSAGLSESKISAIALPVIGADARVAGAVNIIFFCSAMSTKQAAERYLSKLRECVTRIEGSLKEFQERRAEG